MPTVWIPSPMRSLTNGQQTVTVGGATLRQVIDELDCSFPGIKDRLCDGDALRSGIAVSVDAKMATLGLMEQVAEDSEIHFLPAIGGG